MREGEIRQGEVLDAMQEMSREYSEENTRFDPVRLEDCRSVKLKICFNKYLGVHDQLFVQLLPYANEQTL